MLRQNDEGLNQQERNGTEVIVFFVRKPMIRLLHLAPVLINNCVILTNASKKSFILSRHYVNTAVLSKMLHSPNCVDNRCYIVGQSFEIERGIGQNVGDAERAPFSVSNVVASQTPTSNSNYFKGLSDASPKHQIAQQPTSDSTISLGPEAHVMLTPNSMADNVNKTSGSQGLLNDGSPALARKLWVPNMAHLVSLN